ncbi:MAG: hypothetical protein AAFY56_17280 [Pseudomonadota bacterium]
MLKRSDADAIVATVLADTTSTKRIESNLDFFLPDSWGLTGATRNWGYVLSFEDPSEKAIADTVCTGIAEATVAAINRNIKTGLPGLKRIAKAMEVNRVRNGVYHTATGIVTTDKTGHVFDWHATLAAGNPMLYSTIDAWKKDEGGVTYDDFKGFPAF